MYSFIGNGFCGAPRAALLRRSLSGGTERGGRTFVPKSICILPCPERGGGRVRIVSRHQVWVEEGVPGVLVAGVRGCGFCGCYAQRGFAPCRVGFPEIDLLSTVPKLVLRRFPVQFKIIPDEIIFKFLELMEENFFLHTKKRKLQFLTVPRFPAVVQ